VTTTAWSEAHEVATGPGTVDPDRVLPLANIVPLSDAGWAAVLWVTVGACVVWVLGVVLVSRHRYVNGPGPGVQRKPDKDPGTAKTVGMRVVLAVAVGLAAVVLVLFLLGRAGDLLA